MLNFVVLLLAIIGIGVYWYQDKIRQYFWQREFANARLNKKQQAFLEKHMSIYRAMTDKEREKLEQHIVWFLAHKRFIGRDGLQVTDAMALLVAADACVLVLNKPWPLYPNVKEVLLYPSAYYANVSATDVAGLVSYHQVIREGESWPGGTLVLSWHDVLEGNRLPQDGHNLVFHEFAHQLDQVTGNTNGTPALQSKQSYETWAKVCNRAYNTLKAHAAYGMDHVMHPYGATNEAEFFAVATETFLEKPQQMRQFDAELFNMFVDYYGFDPSHWQPN